VTRTWLRTLLALIAAAGLFAAGAALSVATTGKKVPTCKVGQKSTRAHPCLKRKLHTTTKTTTRVTTKPATVSGGPSAGNEPTTTNPCAPGLTIPQANGGDGDDDNNGGPDDGDGCL
jgi:hypothetical protein